MSELIIIGYQDHETAERAYQRVLQLKSDYIVELTGLAVVRIDPDGKQHVDTPAPIVGTSAASGALWGFILGLLFLVPAFGMVVGGLWGAVLGRLSKSGVNKAFRDRVRGMLQPGKAAVVIMASKITEDKFAAGMSEFGGEVLKSSLSEQEEAELMQELGTHTE
ncbi:MAG: DUF1269 domain-containing protein [Brooklawnia sp.]|uniref:DUF1269 domain-containing protein n=1 Tax=Brooklawnia sp. TaxID=2699740 RepID=UPI003C78E3B3